MGVLMTQTAPLAIAAITWKYFIIWLVLDCVFVVIVFFYYPETKNKTLEELAGVFGDVVAESWEETKHRVEDEGLILNEEKEGNGSNLMVREIKHVETVQASN
jgi:hypothetical protein